ncbi:MAG: DUF1127 domain-containing protein [Roseovarius sp.]|nr:DUF1127 domain-containing protein [Roseovarius sp.]
MAYASHNRSGLNALHLDISAFIFHGLRRFEDFRAYRKTLSELSVLSEGQLADMGLSRSGIHRAALESVYGVNV